MSSYERGYRFGRRYDEFRAGMKPPDSGGYALQDPTAAVEKARSRLSVSFPAAAGRHH
jgi:hypothetical protein